MALFSWAGINHHRHHPPCAVHSDIDRAMVPYSPPAAGSDCSDGIVHPQVGDPHTYFQRQRRTTKQLKFEKTPVRQCAIIQIIVGFALVITAMVMLKHDAWGSSVGLGFWGSIFYFSAGILGFLACKFKRIRYIICSTITSIISSFISLSVLTMASIGIKVDSADDVNSKVALHMVNLALGLLGSISALIQGRRGSRALCRGSRDRKSDGDISNVPSVNGSRNSLSRPVSLDSVVVANVPSEPPCYDFHAHISEEPPPSYDEVMKHIKPPPLARRSE